MNFNWPLHQLNGTNVLLDGDLQEVVYMQQPHEVVAEGEPTKVCQLRKSIYGLKQSPCAWFEKFSTILLDFGFVRCLLDYGVFVKRSKKGCIILVYVDDIVISGSDEHGIQATKVWLKSKLYIKDFGLQQYFLGIEVLRHQQGIYLSEKIYVEDRLKEIGMINTKSAEFPLETGTKLHSNCGELHEDLSKYM